MRSLWLALLMLCAFALSNGQVAADQDAFAFFRRQPAPSSSSQISASSDAPAAAASSTASQGDASTSSLPAGAAASALLSMQGGSAPNITGASAVPTSTTSYIPSSPTLYPNMTSLNSTLNGTIFPIDELPLTPEITPAFSVAGVLLMATGLIYCFIGIKNKWIQIFTSSAYLISLSILVLIIYVINPPITLAIEGAYLVACVVPAIMIGGLSLVFRDVTEGLGCAVGGFSISMFLLVLKAGGLLTSTAAKAIFIGCWTVGIFGFSFSHYTRAYALIGSSALGGATALVLGVDCFSRAGLKEFWVYIWALNDNLFPLLTESYPLTRGIRVEIAGIVVLTFFGVMSQLKIWKVIQERREQRRLAEIEANRERDEMEAELGKKLENSNERQRGRWEAVYGERNPSHTDSGVGTEVGTENGSLRKGSFNEKTDAIELTPLPHVIRVCEDEIVPSPTSESGGELKDARGPESESGGSDGAVQSTHETGLPEKPKPALTPAPKLTPLPFKPILSDDGRDDDLESNATFASRNSERSARPYSQRFSGSHLMRKLSKKSNRLSMHTSTSVEALVDRSELGDSLDGDRSVRSTSSYEEPDHDHRSEVHSPLGTKRFSWEAASQAEGLTLDAINAELTKRDDLQTEEAKDVIPSAEDAGEKEVSAKPAGSVKSPGSVKSRASTKSRASVRSLKDHLPQDASKVVLQFRTNEWAKHLSNAEQPQPDELPPIADIVDEAPTTVDSGALLQTALTAEPKPLAIAAKHPNSPPASIRTLSPPTSPPTTSHGFPSPPRATSPRLNPSTSLGSIAETIASNSRLPPSVTDNPNRSTRRLNSQLRSASSPLMGSSIHEDEEASFISPLPSETLMAQRGNLLQYKALTGSTPRLSSSLSVHHTNTTTPYTFSRSPSQLSVVSNHSSSAYSLNTVQNQQLHDAIDDNIPLATRKTMLLNHQQPQAGSADPLKRTPTDPTLRRASMLAAWRASMAADIQQTRQPEEEVSARRSEMWEERQREKQREELARRSQGGWNKDPVAGNRASGMSRMSGMSGREIDGAHREVLRRMQAKADRALKNGDMA